jgi:hypothetical protein
MDTEHERSAYHMKKIAYIDFHTKSLWLTNCKNASEAKKGLKLKTNKSFETVFGP